MSAPARPRVLAAIRDFARAHPDHPALLIGARATPKADEAKVDAAVDRRISYAALLERVEALAAGLRAAGVQRADRCGLVARQGAGFVEAALAILACEACLIPIPDDTRGAALEAAALESALHHLVEESTGFACRSFPRSEVADVDGEGDRVFAALDPAYMRYTSGTTSERKGVIVGHAAVFDRLSNANALLQIGPSDRILWLLPMAHHFLVSILLYLRFGATILLPASSFARDALGLAVRARATVCYASPYHYGMLAKDESELGLDDVRLAISTADGLRADIAERFLARFGLPLVQALGIIEVGLPVVNVASAADKPEALGRPGPAYEVWLRGEDGRAIEGPGDPEHSGEICIRGSGLFDAYLRPWTLARDLTEPDGFRTGDQAYRDADGDLHLAGRRANRINMAGMKFFAEEVEAILEAHPAVRVARVAAREHAHLGEVPVAEIVPSDAEKPPDPKEITAWCRAELPAYKVPREVRVVAALPRTATGKLRRGDDGGGAASRGSSSAPEVGPGTGS